MKMFRCLIFSFQFLVVSSAIGVALGQTILGAFMLLKLWNVNVTAFSWIPILSFSIVVFVSMLGVLSLPFLLLAGKLNKLLHQSGTFYRNLFTKFCKELMPEKIKDGSVAFCMGISWIFSFITIKYLPLLNDLIGFYGSMFLFAGICVCAAVFIIVFMPETKRKTHEEIMKSLE